MRKEWWIQFFNSLYYLISGDLPIETALSTLEKNEKNTRQAKTIGYILGHIFNGNTLSSSLNMIEQGPEALCVQLLRSGELTGNVPRALEALCFYLNKRKENKDKIVSSLIYPLFICIVLFVGVFFMVFMILPNMESFLQQMGKESEINDLLNRIRIVQQQSINFLIILLIFVAFFFFYTKRPITKCNKLDCFLYTLTPKSIKDREFYSFFSIVDVLASGGIAIDDTIEFATEAILNRVLYSELKKIVIDLRNGQSMSELFRNSIFPIEIKQWISFSEQTGDLKKVFHSLTGFYEKKIETGSKKIASIIEPIFIIFTGLVLLFFIVLFILPLIDMMGNIL